MSSLVRNVGTIGGGTDQTAYGPGQYGMGWWFNGPNDTGDHGTSVASLVAARGENASGITGVMWRADLRLHDAAIQPNGNVLLDPSGVPTPSALYFQLFQAGSEGTRVINVSWQINWWALMGHGYDPATETNATQDSVNRELTRRVRDNFAGVIQNLELSSPSRRPLFVVAAGNTNTDAYWSGFPRARETYPRRVLVVAAAERSSPGVFTRASFSNTGADVIAPGERIGEHGGDLPVAADQQAPGTGREPPAGWR